MGNCSTSGGALGVRIEVLEKLLTDADAAYEATMAKTAPVPEYGLFSCTSRPETVDVKKSITMEMVATMAIRPRAREAERPYVVWLAGNLDTLELPENERPIGGAQVLLMTGENSPADTVLALVHALKLPADTYFYLDEIASYDALAPQSQFLKGDPMPPSPVTRRPSVLSSVSATPGTLCENMHRSSLSTLSLRSPAMRKNERQQKTKERRHLAEREGYWANGFLAAVEQVDKAVFAIDGINDAVVCGAMRDLQWLFALYAALTSRRPTEVLLVMAKADKAAFKEIMLEKTSRSLFIRAVKKTSLEHARARTPLEEFAIRDAIGIGAKTVAAEATLAARLLDWLVGEWTEMLDGMQLTIEHQHEPLKQEFFDSYKAFIGQLLELELDERALERATTLRNVCIMFFGIEHDNTLDADNILANMLRRFERIDEAIVIYTDIIARASGTLAMMSVASKSRFERLAGAHMQLANSLRDKNEHADAETHYRAALETSANHMGKKALNTHYCQISLANNLRAQSAADLPASFLQGLAQPSTSSATYALLAQSEALYRAAAAGLQDTYSSLENVTFSARLNHACVLLEMSAFDRTFVDEAHALFHELHARSSALFGARHESTLYIEAKQGELLASYKGEFAKGKTMVRKALRALSRELKLSDKHPRVLETRAALISIEKRAVLDSIASIRRLSMSMDGKSAGSGSGGAAAAGAKTRASTTTAEKASK